MTSEGLSTGYDAGECERSESGPHRPIKPVPFTGSDVTNLRVEWTVQHAQGTHPGPFTEQRAREWIASDIKADERRQHAYRGKQRLLRRYVSEWEEVPLDSEQASE